MPYWFSYDYWLETQHFGKAIRELLSLERVARRWRFLLKGLIRNRRRGASCNRPPEALPIQEAAA